MIIQRGISELRNNLLHQIHMYWCNYDEKIVIDAIEPAIGRMSNILEHININNKYVWHDNGVRFNPFHSVQYSIFLWLVSNEIYLRGISAEADLVYYLNKIMHACDWFYAIKLPDVFYAEHPVGSVLGRAEYGEQFFIYQGTTVGGNRDKEGKIIYPKIGNNVLMYANSTILGDSLIGDNVIVSANTFIINETIPSNSIVFGKSPELIIKQRTIEEICQIQLNNWDSLKA